MAQAPAIDWQLSMGGTASDVAEGLCATTDGGYVLTGYVQSNDVDVTGFQGVLDLWVAKVNATGALEWAKTYGGSSEDIGTAIVQTADQGYVVAGFTRSADGDVGQAFGSSDVWLLKLDPAGDLIWERSYGGSGRDEAYDLVVTADGGFLVVGQTNSTDGDVSGGMGSYDAWVLRLDSAGNVLWQHPLGSPGWDVGWNGLQLSDGAFLVAGTVDAPGGDVSSYNGGLSDAWLVKLDDAGLVVWEHSYGGSGSERFGGIVELSDGRIALGGGTTSSDGDVSNSYGQGDAWLVVTDSTGQLLWEMSYGGSGGEGAGPLMELPNGDLVVLAITNSTDGDVGQSLGGYDVWLFRVDASGTLLWEGSYGGSAAENVSAFVATPDGGYALAGTSASNDGDVTGNQGLEDWWLVKLLPDHTSIAEGEDPGRLGLWPNPAQQAVFLPGESGDLVEVLTAAGMRVPLTSAVFHAEGHWELDARGLAPGVYLVQLTGAAGRRVGRLVRE